MVRQDAPYEDCGGERSGPSGTLVQASVFWVLAVARPQAPEPRTGTAGQASSGTRLSILGADLVSVGDGCSGLEGLLFEGGYFGDDFWRLGHSLR